MLVLVDYWVTGFDIILSGMTQNAAQMEGKVSWN